MTLLDRRREELRGERIPQKPVEKRRSLAVRPPQPQPSFLHVQAALGNRATGSLLRGGTLQSRGDLLAEELSPVVQLARILHAQKKTSPGFLVPDGTAPAAGQMTRGGFLAAMRDAAREAAEQGFAGTGHTARGCPWIEHYFHFYQRQSAERIETDLLRYVPAARGATSAGELLGLASDHVRANVRHWAATGELTGVPRGLPGAGLVGALAGSLAAVQTQLGEGRPLDSPARSRMERAFGTRFAEVRLHTGAAAARLARRFRARAFAVGPHVAFDHGEYRPGTLVGDAVLAHELAHTLQQRDAGTPALHRTVPVRRMEGEANTAAAGVLARLWGGARTLGDRLAHPARPGLRTGLALARCCRDDFSDRELRDYLDHLKSSGIEKGCEGDNKARAVVHGNHASPGKFPLEDIHVQRMIEEMIDGPTGGDDENAILELLKQSKPDRLQVLFTTGGLTAKGLLSDFSGSQEKALRAFFEQRFEGGLKALEAGDVRAIPEAEEFPFIPAKGESRGFRAEDLKRLKERGAKLTFTGNLSPLSAEVQQLLLDNIASTVSFVLDPENPDRIQKVEELHREWEKEQQKRTLKEQESHPFFETPAERIDARDLYHAHVCVPRAVLTSSSRLQELRRAAGAYNNFGPATPIGFEIREAIGHEAAPTTRPQARRAMAVVEKHRARFLEALGPLLQALEKVPEAGINYHTWEKAAPRHLTSDNPIRNLFTPLSTNQPEFQRPGHQDCDSLINFSFHVSRRGEITLLPGASSEMVRAFELLNGWDEAPEAAEPAPGKPSGDKP